MSHGWAGRIARASQSEKPSRCVICGSLGI
nr:MAG TPA: Kruppel-like factor 3 finger, kruppel-like, DNA BINDING [Caudoviricetes sp.]